MNQNVGNCYAVTFDIDWAPDFCIQTVIDVLQKYSVKCTFFVTHSTPLLAEIQNNPLFELGLHPNFLENSTHGSNEDEVLSHCLQLLPDCKIVRTHALYQSGKILHRMVSNYGIETDLSLFLNKTPFIQPHKIYYDKGLKPLFRIPYFWEDDHEMYDPQPEWDFASDVYHQAGIKIFNFHPVYVYLNANSMNPYNELKTKGYLAKLPQILFDSIKNESDGAGKFFEQLCMWLSAHSVKTYTVTELKNKLLKTHA